MKQPTAEELSDPAKRRELDRKMILSPDEWPVWPVLPLKNRPPRTGKALDETCAYLRGDPPPPDQPITVWLGVIYMAPLGKRLYPNLDALLDDWTVD